MNGDGMGLDAFIIRGDVKTDGKRVIQICKPHLGQVRGGAKTNTGGKKKKRDPGNDAGGKGSVSTWGVLTGVGRGRRR